MNPTGNFEDVNAKKALRNDKEVLEDLMLIVPSDGIIEFLRTFSFGNAYRQDFMDPLYEFIDQRRGPEHEFVDAELEALRKHLRETIEVFLSVLRKNTFRQREIAGDHTFCRIPDEWEMTQGGRYHQAIEDMNAAAGNVCRAYDDLVRTARTRALTGLGTQPVKKDTREPESRPKKFMDLTNLSSWATILGLFIGIAALVIAVFPSETHDWAVKKLHAVFHNTPEPKPAPPAPLPQTTPAPLPQTFTPPDLEAHKWAVHIRASGFPAFEGQTQTPFLADNTYEAYGNFLVPTGAVDQHIDCPSSVKGHWHYANANHAQLAFDMTVDAVAGRTHDEFVQCSATLQPLQSTRKTASGTCTFSSPETCTANDFEIHLSALP